MDINQKLEKIIGILTDQKSIELKILQKLHLNNTKATKTYETYHYYENCYRVLNLYFKAYNIVNSSQINFELIYDFIDYCKKNNHQNSSINKYIKCLKAGFNFCIKNKYLDENPLNKFEFLKEQNKAFKTIEEESIIKIFKYVYSLDDSLLINLRYKILIHILIETGTRLNEIANIKIENIAFDKNRIKLETTKTKKDRLIPLSDDLKNMILIYLKKTKIKSGFLFINFNNFEQLDKRSLARILYKLKSKLKITESISPHKWRHTFATTSLKNGCDIITLKEILGHEDISTTDLYIHINFDHVQSQHQKFNPINNFKKNI